MIGETIGGRYEVLSALGEGGMGAVFEARHTGTGRRVALKTIHPGKVKSQQLLARFRVEARAAGSIESEYVVQVFDVDVDEARRMPFLAMEFLSGEDLDGLLGKLGALPQDLALRIAAQTCLGLEKAHAEGILHRDVKPANLILSKRDGGERRVKIVDFGLAKALDDVDEDGKSQSLTMTGMLLGSPQYMSPEQARAQKGLDARTDVWSLGMVIYQMLTGRTAFKGVTPIPKLLEAITSQPVAPVRDTAPWVDLGVATAVERALEIDPERRYPTIRAMREALMPFLPNGIAIQEKMLVPGPKPVSAPKVEQNDIATVAKAAAATPARAAGEQPIKPTKVSGKPLTNEPVAPGTEPLPKMVIPVEVPADTGDVAPRKPAAGTLVSGQPQGPAPTVRAPVPARSTEVAPMTERVEPIDRTEQAARPPQPLIPKAPTVERQKKRLPIGAILLAGVAVAALAVAITWAQRQPNGEPSPYSATAASIQTTTSRASSAPAAELPPAPRPERPPSLLVGKWKTDTGKQLEAVDVHGDIEFRVADVKGFAEQGYRVGDPRFTLKPRPDSDLYDVVDHVRPLPLTGMTFDDAARPSCLVEYTQVAKKPLTARLEKGRLIVTVTYLVPAKAMFESTGTRITKCKDLEQSQTSPIENPLSRVE